MDTFTPRPQTEVCKASAMSFAVRVVVFFFCSFSPDLLRRLLSQCRSVGLGNAGAWQLTWGNLIRGLSSSTTCAPQTFLARAGHRYPPFPASAHVMLAFMFLPIKAPKKEETSFRLCASSTFYRRAIFLSSFFFKQCSKSRFLWHHRHFPHPTLIQFLSSFQPDGFWVSYQTGVLSRA